jgi:hypothetical protein
MHTVSVLLLLAGAVILAGVVAVAMGHGGEMAEFPSDYIPPTLGDLLTAADVAMLRPPSALWGYNTQVTDEALSRIAQIVTERDVEIAVLRQQLAELRSGPGGARPASASRPAPAPVVVDEPAPAPVVVDEPAPAPVVVDEPPPAPVVVDEPPPAPVVVDEPGAAPADASAVAEDGDAAARDETPAPPPAAGEAAAPDDD